LLVSQAAHRRAEARRAGGCRYKFSGLLAERFPFKSFSGQRWCAFASRIFHAAPALHLELRDRKGSAQRLGASPYRKKPIKSFGTCAASHPRIEDLAVTPLLRPNIRKAGCDEARQDKPGIERKIE